MNKVHFSSKTDDWATPQEIFDDLDKEFDFNVDVCANELNKKVGTYFTKPLDDDMFSKKELVPMAPQDGLKQSWEGLRCWMNPPYGDTIGEWVKKASEARGGVVVCLLPARTDTKYFHEYIYQNPRATIRFIKGRLKFGNSKSSAPFPSMVVIFK